MIGTNKVLTVLAASMAMGIGVSANAAITYVDIDATNTVGNDGDVAYATVTDGSSDAWTIRTVFGNAGEILQSTNEDSATLRTTIGGLTAGTSYDIYVLFWTGDATNTSNVWEVSAGLESDLSDQQVYTQTDTAVQAALSDFDGPVLVAEGDRVLMRDKVGVAVADINGEIAVYVDDVVPQGGGDRTWVDGVGYEAVPEPSSLALMGLGGLAMLRRRRA